jgi:hypothetical protein
MMTDIEKARGLGWASLAIGATEMAFPNRLEKWMGIGNGQNTGILRVLGVREILHGVDILTHEDPTNGVYARCAGDMLDSALIGVAATKTKRPAGLACVFAGVLPIVLLDMFFAWKLGKRKAREKENFLRRMFH